MTTAKTDEQQTISPQDVQRLEECVASGGVAVFPTDTVYGVCCDPDDEQAARRLYALKGAPGHTPAAVMCFALEPVAGDAARARLDERAALAALLPGPRDAAAANPRPPLRARGRIDPTRSGCGCRAARAPAGARGAEQAGDAVERQPLRRARRAHARSRSPQSVRAGADLVLDGGELPGMPSTVIDLRDYAPSGAGTCREGALRAAPSAGRDVAPVASSSCRDWRPEVESTTGKR